MRFSEGAVLEDYATTLPTAALRRAALLPLRESATLQSIAADAYPGEGSQGARPVADFWREYGAQQAAAKK